MVDKIIGYATDEGALGNWRQQIYFVADDGDGNLHHRDIEELSAEVDESEPTFRVRKLYLDDFPQERTGAIGKAQEPLLQPSTRPCMKELWLLTLVDTETPLSGRQRRYFLAVR